MHKVTLKNGRQAVGWAVGIAALAGASAVGAKNWGSWSAPANLNTMSTPDINSGAVDGCASHSPDGLTIVFNSNRLTPAGDSSQNLYMATRASTSDDFGAAILLPSPVNSSSQEACPTIRPGKKLYFASNRDDPAYDIYVTRLGNNGWSAPTRLGPNINTNGMMEEAPAFYEDDQGREVMVFTRRSPTSLTGAGGKLYYSVDGGPSFPVQGGPDSNAGDNRASFTKDGLTIFWDSVRGGPMPDLYYATRTNTTEPFGDAIALTGLNGPGFDARPYISWDGSFLTFSSGRAGNITLAPDMWIAERDKITGN
jgi:Tol biopolymer transport system component